MKIYKKLFREGKSKVVKVNGYIIQYNSMWKTYQVSHPEIGALIAEFYKLEDATEYCKRG